MPTQLDPSLYNPQSWEDWIKVGQRMFELATRALDPDSEPSWEMLSFRQENDFYAGCFGDYLQLWHPVIKELEPPFRARAYSVLALGVDIYEKLKMIKLR